jgi:hypothetical protein
MPPEEQVPVQPAPAPAEPNPAPAEQAEAAIDLDDFWNKLALDDSGLPSQPPGEPPAAEPAPVPPVEPDKAAAPAPVPPASPAPAPVQRSAPEPQPAAPEAPSADDIIRDYNERRAAFEREARDLEQKLGRPLMDPARIQRRIQGLDQYKEVKENFPEFVGAVEFLQDERDAALRDSILSEVDQRRVAQAVEAHHDGLLTAHPDYDLIESHPDPFLLWIDEKPYREGAALADVVAHGSTGQVAALISQFKKERGITSYSELLSPEDGAAAPPASPAESQPATPAPSQAPAAASRPAAAPVNPAKAAAAAAVPGEGTQTPAPAPGQRSATDDDVQLAELWKTIPAAAL